MEAIHALIEAEHAAVLPELEAKIAEAKWETLTTPIDPHHPSTARRHLVREHVILEDTRRTLTARGVRVTFVKGQPTFTGEDTAMATLPLSVMGAFAQFGRSLRKDWILGGASTRGPNPAGISSPSRSSRS